MLLWERSYMSFFEEEPSIVARSLDPMWIRLGFGCSGFFTWTSRTPFL